MRMTKRFNKIVSDYFSQRLAENDALNRL